ncbi:succinate dehydrogenase, hydrophobic membrane anchor protein [Falsirhodobacter sp. 20TX0035]|uniref:succinate dehydrogenase, hydrophobic membrane anchor protein n=1 Tax=Falsirhodobacter sp. 20TX0035 TaxID=3022019 RepID=UPI00232B5179|nr:succinate dehydrogenase, hydrophobic membrane anchor protein [Falsirhodobacter sp. 20TX0035]MDB6452370.1 succinate dehydrogenase, hydrophobic membrane anchor protein [Falsirhodobacter sp. 20TX0035]
MRYLTDYKRVHGHGSAHSGAHHYWNTQVSSAALVILVPLFIFTFGHALGMEYEDAVEYYSRPLPVVIAALTMIVGLIHFKNGAQVMFEDYTKAKLRISLILLSTAFSYVCIGLVLFALVKLAL